VYFGKTADSIELPFGMVGRVDPRKHVLDRGPYPPRLGENLGEICVAQCNVEGDCDAA